MNAPVQTLSALTAHATMAPRAASAATEPTARRMRPVHSMAARVEWAAPVVLSLASVVGSVSLLIHAVR